jgi:hypothetical protein
MVHCADGAFRSIFLSDSDDGRCYGYVPELKRLLDKEDLEYWYMVTRNRGLMEKVVERNPFTHRDCTRYVNSPESRTLDVVK